jgi:hypothetical protein
VSEFSISIGSRAAAVRVRSTTLAVILAAAACGRSTPASAPTGTGPAATASYDQQNGRLSELDFDRNGDGKIDTRAMMDGVLVKSIEIDRDGDGKTDRWEYYEPVTVGAVPAGSPDGHSIIARAEEANGKTSRITRREFYEQGLIVRVEEDTDSDGRMDKWETYQGGLIATVDLDLSHRGRPERRFVYRPDGSLDHVEADARGDGNFKTISTTASDPRKMPAARSASPAAKGRSHP